MFGCDNFCTYCIVPYVRGRERSRSPKDIIRECEKLAADGVKEVMLLGQNVNSYGFDFEDGDSNKITFAELLKMVCEVEGIERVRFMTPHPKDLSDELIEAMASCDKVCHHMHLPLQSGSTEILKKMNRRYTKEHYLGLVEKLRARIPDVAITTDIIVGFPGETEEDFLETMDVVDKVHYDSAFTFIYSKRTGTPAAAMENQVPENVVKDRFDRLLSLVQKHGHEKVQALEGTVQEVLVEDVNEQDSSLVSGKLANNVTVHFPGDESMIGKLINVRLNCCKGFYFIGELAD
jgi:tRNA-2-methylthio-N6-dimethylallyladenosine synthase